MRMTDSQLYLAVGLPAFEVVISTVMAMMQHSSLLSRLTSLEFNVNSRFASIDNRYDKSGKQV